MTLIVAAIMAVAHLYIGWRLQTSARILFSKPLFRRVPFSLLLSFYLLPVTALIQYVVWSNPDLLAYPKVLTYWFWFGLIFSFQLVTWFLVLDGIKLLMHGFNVWARPKINRRHARGAYILMAILFVFTAMKMRYDTTAIQTDFITFKSEKIPEGLQGLRLVHISDVQGDEYTGRKEIGRYIQKVNDLEPDVIVFTGDLVSYGTDFIDMAAEELAKADATYGIYAVVGDHDYWAGVPNIKSAFKKYGVPLLQDQTTFIPVAGDSLLLTGITEVYSKHISPVALKSLTREYADVSLKIIASHQATEKVVKEARRSGYAMLLAGHTHGGQLRVPFLGMTFSAAERETPYLSGLYEAGNLFININNGLGFTLAPVRYNAPPNISVIDFVLEEEK